MIAFGDLLFQSQDLPVGRQEVGKMLLGWLEPMAQKARAKIIARMVEKSSQA